MLTKNTTSSIYAPGLNDLDHLANRIQHKFATYFLTFQDSFWLDPFTPCLNKLLNRTPQRYWSEKIRIQREINVFHFDNKSTKSPQQLYSRVLMSGWKVAKNDEFFCVGAPCNMARTHRLSTAVIRNLVFCLFETKTLKFFNLAGKWC